MENKLWYKNPANSWNEALPIGNGRLGAMVWGNAGSGSIGRECVDLNEDTIWYGKYRDRNNRDSKQNLPKIRELLFEGKYDEAQNLARMAMSSNPKYFGAYQPLGKMYIENHRTEEVENYYRELNLDTAVVTVKYSQCGANITKRYFASYPDNAIFIHFKADREILDFSCNIMRRPSNEETLKIDEKTVAMLGAAGDGGVKFACTVRGEGNGEVKIIGDYINFKNCSEALIKVTARSDFFGENPLKACLEDLEKIENKDIDSLLESHIESYQKVYKRVEADFGAEESDLPTDERLERVKNSKRDNGLIELIFKYGRYIMISSSRPETQPMNLQALWCDSFTPAWECNYTININTQMNYWLSEAGNLSEFHTPLFDLIERMLPNGKKTAKIMYGCDGFVAHHCTNIWGDTAIEGNFFPSPIWPMGGAWLALHMMEHFEFTQDIGFLEDRAYPVIRECAIFFHEYMTEDKDGYLVTGPSISPENTFITKENKKGSLCMGPYMDMEIVTQLFKSCIKASGILYEDLELALILAQDLEKIRPLRKNSYGGLMEWQEDYEEDEPGHRHMSHLYALHPGNEITFKTPELMEACEKTLEHRLKNGGGHTGWSAAWIANFYARLMQGDKALDMLYHVLTDATYKNLFNVHPPFQVDGNMGEAEAVIQLLLQSHADAIQLLPALPSCFKNGFIKGLKARGNFEIDIYWQDGKLKKADIRSYAGKSTVIKLPEKMKVKINGIPVGEQETISLSSEKGKEYEISCF